MKQSSLKRDSLTGKYIQYKSSPSKSIKNVTSLFKRMKSEHMTTQPCKINIQVKCEVSFEMK